MNFAAMTLLIFGLLASTRPLAQEALSRFTFPYDNIATYSGRLTDDAVDNFIRSANVRDIRVLIITSLGGNLLSGIRLGHWVRDKNVEVIVRGICMSSCANYVFLAAPRKTIDSDALVVWHGGAEQKNFRVNLSRIKYILARVEQGENLSKTDSHFLEENVSRLQMWEKQVLAQRELFEKIGVDEYITRAGQEPIDYQSAWTMSVASMKNFGVDNVTAPPGYGEDKYLRQLQKRRRIPLDGRVASILVTLSEFGEKLVVQDVGGVQESY